MHSRVLSVTIAAAAFVLLAADLAVAQTTPIADGSVANGEYSAEQGNGAIRIFARFDADRIYLAAVARTTGWVAIGVDSARMDGAKIFMGYFADGKEAFSTQSGVRHSHNEATSFTALSHAVAEANGVTTMEIVLDRNAFLAPDQSSLDVIYAMGSADTFRQYHSTRGATSFAVK